MRILNQECQSTYLPAGLNTCPHRKRPVQCAWFERKLTRTSVQVGIAQWATAVKCGRHSASKVTRHDKRLSESSSVSNAVAFSLWLPLLGSTQRPQRPKIYAYPPRSRYCASQINQICMRVYVFIYIYTYIYISVQNMATQKHRMWTATSKNTETQSIKRASGLLCVRIPQPYRKCMM